jgi:hypothetical protein
MTQPRPSTFPQSGFDGFLLSNVAIQPNGMPLTVLSLFARMGMDPWSEAERLSIVPNELAVSWMAAAITRCPPNLWQRSDVTMLASDLVDRLPVYPHNAGFDGTVINGLEHAPVRTLMMLFYLAASMLLMLFLAMG